MLLVEAPARNSFAPMPDPAPCANRHRLEASSIRRLNADLYLFLIFIFFAGIMKLANHWRTSFIYRLYYFSLSNNVNSSATIFREAFFSTLLVPIQVS